ncbi:Hypothetical predicted protein [Pelobates cultripes]|uniref:Uncharacterized protein n=1 Tax=Pelobates cultripes TaxID=61616 RepID=A0AAD1SBP2_PELCU|nr:Hypothetical predicted protein [Pelobates cultripes]
MDTLIIPIASCCQAHLLLLPPRTGRCYPNPIGLPQIASASRSKQALLNYTNDHKMADASFLIKQKLSLPPIDRLSSTDQCLQWLEDLFQLKLRTMTARPTIQEGARRGKNQKVGKSPPSLNPLKTLPRLTPLQFGWRISSGLASKVQQTDLRRRRLMPRISSCPQRKRDLAHKRHQVRGEVKLAHKRVLEW